jgi:hypothetical protein
MHIILVVAEVVFSLNGGRGVVKRGEVQPQLSSPNWACKGVALSKGITLVQRVIFPRCRKVLKMRNKHGAFLQARLCLGWGKFFSRRRITGEEEANDAGACPIGSAMARDSMVGDVRLLELGRASNHAIFCRSSFVPTSLWALLVAQAWLVERGIRNYPV